MIIDSFRNTIKSYRMLQGRKNIFVACSGGPDSIALLYLMRKLQRESKFKLGILHANHQLRGKESDADELFVKRLAEKFSLPFVSDSLSVKEFAKDSRLSLEEAARILRYQFFTKAAREHKIDTIALGHTMDDQAETVLMRVFSGSGLVGFGGIRALFERNQVRFIRPLSQIPKHEILDYLKRGEILFRTDESNLSDRFLRNKIRLNVMPVLKKEFGENLPKVLSRIAETTAQDSDFLETTAALLYMEFHKQKKNEILFSRKQFSQLHPSMQFRMVQAAAHEFGSEFAFDHWRELERLFTDHRTFETDLPNGIVCAVTQSSVALKYKQFKRVLKDLSDFSYLLNLDEQVRVAESRRTIECKQIHQKPRTVVKNREDYALLDASKLKFPLLIRNRKEGDVFKPLGQEREQKLKDYFIKQKIPYEQRNSIPLVVANGQIVWIAGIALSDDAKITSETNKIIKLAIK